MIIVFPDEAAVFPVFRNGGIANHLPILVNCIEVKDKKPSGIQIVVHQGKCFLYILILKEIIHAVADADHCSNCAVQIQLPHILTKIKDFTLGLLFFEKGRLQHFLGVVHPDHIIALSGKKLRQRPCPAAQIHYQIALRGKNPILSFFRRKIPSHRLAGPVSLYLRGEKFRPLPVGGVIHKNIIHTGKIRIRFQCINPPALQPPESPQRM